MLRAGPLQADNCAHIVDMENELNIPSIRDRLDFQLSIECFKQINPPNSSLSKMFVQKETGRATRSANSKIMTVPRVRTNMGSNAFSVKGPTHWNKLPVTTRVNTDQPEFRRTISKLNNRDVNHPT